MESFISTINIIFSAGTVLFWAVSLVLIVGLATRDKSALYAFLAKHALVILFLVSFGGLLGSLVYSEMIGFTPCMLCWYQRIAMYPQVVLLALAWIRRDEGIKPYSLALAVIGAVISTFHVLVERFPWIEGSGGVCDPANPCTIKWVEELGFITIPTMALSAFVLIALLMSHLPSGAAAGAGPTPDQEHDAP